MFVTSYYSYCSPFTPSDLLINIKAVLYLVSTSSVYSNSKREKCNAPHEFKLRGRQDTAELYSAVSRIPWSQTLHWEGHWWVKLFWKIMFWTNFLLTFLLFQFLCSSMLEASCYAGHITVSQSKKFRIPPSQTLHTMCRTAWWEGQPTQRRIRLIKLQALWSLLKDQSNKNYFTG